MPQLKRPGAVPGRMTAVSSIHVTIIWRIWKRTFSKNPIHSSLGFQKPGYISTQRSRNGRQRVRSAAFPFLGQHKVKMSPDIQQHTKTFTRSVNRFLGGSRRNKSKVKSSPTSDPSSRSFQGRKSHKRKHGSMCGATRHRLEADAGVFKKKENCGITKRWVGILGQINGDPNCAQAGHRGQSIPSYSDLTESTD